jgi:esterase/lipase superfamily enzyme
VGADRIHIIAHSMGNRAIVRALEQVVLAGINNTSKPMYHEIVLTAPDIDAEVFKQLASTINKAANRVTLYASSKDVALAASKRFHGYSRAGDSRDSIVVVPGVDTIDASMVDTSFLGHSYYGDSRSVLSDLFNVLQGGAPPDRRFGMLPRKLNGTKYWAFLP